MNRMQLLDTLTTVAPALSKNDLIPVMSAFWFLGERVMTFNDQIALSAPLKTSFSGAIDGGVLLDLFKTSRAKEVDMEVRDGTLHIKAASTRAKIGVLPDDSFVFKMPKQKTDPTVFSGDSLTELLEGIDRCMKSTATDTTVPDYLGVTFMPGEKGIDLYSTSGVTIMHYAVKCKSNLKHRVILPSQFCERLAVLARTAPTVSLEVNKDHALATIGKVVLFGRVIESEKPLNFERVIKEHVPSRDAKKMAFIPSKFNMILDRAAMISESKAGRTSTEIKVEDGRASFISRSDRGEIIDKMQISSEQKDVRTFVEARRVRIGVGLFERILFTERCVVMASDKALFMVASQRS